MAADERTTDLTQADPSRHRPPSTQSASVDQAQPGFPRIANYEILEAIGRGGMGVVYKARHIPLNRIVALKMVALHSPELLARFHLEAEAIASLQHPNIVQIYEVGEYEGHPFLSLQYLPGGTLAQTIDSTPQPPREAARMVELLARAMHAAHQRGVIHRDLKPANVLLTDSGAPRITDFGLAKQLDAADEVTQAGDILGTPSYMAAGASRGPRQGSWPTHRYSRSGGHSLRNVDRTGAIQGLESSGDHDAGPDANTCAAPAAAAAGAGGPGDNLLALPGKSAGAALCQCGRPGC